MHYVYVIKSLIDNSFYIGQTSNLNERLRIYNSKEENHGVTKRKIPWDIFYTIEVENSTIAIKIEQHIKKMKSRNYIKNLKKYPEMGQKLIEKYS